MHFELTEEQRALRDSVARMLSDHYSLEKRRAMAASEFDRGGPVWLQLQNLGITALPIPEEYGGYGGGAVDLLVVMQEFGRALLLEPFLASSVLGATALRLAGSVTDCENLLPAVATGEMLLAWAHDEPEGRHASHWVATSAKCQNGEWRLHGVKSNVLHATQADHFIVTARVAGSPQASDGCAIFLVKADADGLHTRNYRLVDDAPAGELHLQNVVARPLGDPTSGLHARTTIEGTLAVGIAAVCADMVGAMEAAYDLTREYLAVRKQFGRTLGENQALRHRAAEMLVGLETARSMAIAAAVAAATPGDAESTSDLHRAKLVVGRQARTLCHIAVQLHGGIGVAEEYAVGHYLRRIHVMDQLFGDSEAHASRLAALL